jgi:hypothetical protein
MGSKETRQMYIRTYIGRSVLVALSALPPGVNELCVCVCVCVITLSSSSFVGGAGHPATVSEVQ